MPLYNEIKDATEAYIGHLDNLVDKLEQLCLDEEYYDYVLQYYSDYDKPGMD